MRTPLRNVVQSLRQPHIDRFSLRRGQLLIALRENLTNPLLRVGVQRHPPLLALLAQPLDNFIRQIHFDLHGPIVSTPYNMSSCSPSTSRPPAPLPAPEPESSTPRTAPLKPPSSCPSALR